MISGIWENYYTTDGVNVVANTDDTGAVTQRVILVYDVYRPNNAIAPTGNS